jgi:hypothetical protein
MCCRYLENHLLTDESRASWLVKATVACTFLPSSRVLCSEGGTGDSGELKASRRFIANRGILAPKGQLRSEALTAAREKLFCFTDDIVAWLLSTAGCSP